jgi:hypothetical protein
MMCARTGKNSFRADDQERRGISSRFHGDQYMYPGFTMPAPLSYVAILQ